MLIDVVRVFTSLIRRTPTTRTPSASRQRKAVTVPQAGSAPVATTMSNSPIRARNAMITLLCVKIALMEFMVNN